MSNVDHLVNKFNSEFTVIPSHVEYILNNRGIVDFGDKDIVYICSNRKQQVCQMFQLWENNVISQDENKELQKRTKGFAVAKLIQVRNAIVKQQEAEKQAKEQTVNSAQIAKLQAQIAELEAQNKAITKALLNEQQAHKATKQEFDKVSARYGKLKSRTVLIGKTLTNVFTRVR